jgi:hypothetical protein
MACSNGFVLSGITMYPRYLFPTDLSGDMGFLTGVRIWGPGLSGAQTLGLLAIEFVAQSCFINTGKRSMIKFFYLDLLPHLFSRPVLV